MYRLVAPRVILPWRWTGTNGVKDCALGWKPRHWHQPVLPFVPLHTMIRLQAGCAVREEGIVSKNLTWTAPGGWDRVALASLLGGSLDLFYALAVSAVRGRMPMTVLQSVASGWLGKSAYDGGVASATLGLVTHYGILFVMAGFFARVVARIAWVCDHPRLAGLTYGLGLYAVMYGAVLPLRFPDVFPRLNGWVSVTDVIVHALVGLVIATLVLRKVPQSN